MYAPGLALRDPPPTMGGLTGGGKGVGSPSMMTGGGENREVGGGREEMAVTVQKRPRSCTN